MSDNRLVKQLRVGRAPSDDVTIIDFDGVAFALSPDQRDELSLGLATSRVGANVLEKAGKKGPHESGGW